MGKRWSIGSWLEKALPQVRSPFCPMAQGETDRLLDLAASMDADSGFRAKDRRLFSHIASCRTCATEWDAILRDAAVTRVVKVTTPWFSIRDHWARFSNAFSLQTLPAFRSGGASSIVHSNIFPVGCDYVIVEIAGEGNGLELRLHKGEKNEVRPRISLYRDAEPIEVFYLRKNRNWRLDALFPGHYRLMLEKKSVLAFQIS